MKGWDRHPNGDVAVGPLLGWAATIAPMTGLLRLETAASEEQLQSGQVQAVQIAMTVPQMRELSALLLRMVDAVEGQPLGTAQ